MEETEMETIRSLLDDAKKAKGVESHYALAKALELPTQRISDYYNGTGSKVPDEFACLQIAKALGRSYEEVSAIVRIEAEKDETRREVWREHLKRLGGYAAGIIPLLLAGLLFVTFIVTYPVQSLAATGFKASSYPVIQIMRVTEGCIGWKLPAS